MAELWLAAASNGLPDKLSFAGVAPLTKAAQLAIIQPLLDKGDVAVLEAFNFKLERGSGGDGLGVGKGDAFALRGGGAQRALAVAGFPREGQRDRTRGDKDAPVDVFL